MFWQSDFWSVGFWVDGFWYGMDQIPEHSIAPNERLFFDASEIRATYDE